MEGVALVFVSTNEGEVLLPALRSLFTDTSIRRDLEVVVIDNASDDGAAEVIANEFPQVKVLRRAVREGLPANLNHGIVNTTAPFVMLCNSDLIFPAGSLEELASFMGSHPRAGLVAPKLVGPDGTPRASARRWYTWPVLLMLKGPWQSAFRDARAIKESLYDDWDQTTARKVDWVPCPATMARRDAMDAVGMMDERFRLYFDDVDISLRMHEGGWEVWCDPAATIVHLEQRSSVKPLSRAWRWHLVSLFKFWWKHKGLKPRR